MFTKLLLQLMTMLGDVIILTAIGCLFYERQMFTLVLGIVTLVVWFKAGGFMAWRPSEIKNFWNSKLWEN